MIGNLLEDCHVTQARWLANLFNHSSLELDVVMVTYYPIYIGITITSKLSFSFDNFDGTVSNMLCQPFRYFFPDQ